MGSVPSVSGHAAIVYRWCSPPRVRRHSVLNVVPVTGAASSGTNQPRQVANPARGTGKKLFSLSPFAPKNLASRDRFGRPVWRQSASSFSTPCLNPMLLGGLLSSLSAINTTDTVDTTDNSVIIHIVNRHQRSPPSSIGSVPSLSGHAFAYRWPSSLRYFLYHTCHHVHLTTLVGVGKERRKLIGP